jgi:hypothetical protein
MKQFCARKLKTALAGVPGTRPAMAPFYCTAMHRDLEQDALGSKTQFKVRPDSSDVFDLRVRLNELVEDVMPPVALHGSRKLARGAGRIDGKKSEDCGINGKGKVCD